jgi:hypothetical protein
MVERDDQRRSERERLFERERDAAGTWAKTALATKQPWSPLGSLYFLERVLKKSIFTVTHSYIQK